MSRVSLGIRTIVCTQCGKDYTYSRSDRKGASATVCNACLVANRRRKVKELAIEYKGGKCQICGYDKSKRALSFHHIDPTTKEFGIADGGVTRSWDKTKKELDKTILLCANCHMEVEEKLTSIP